MSDLHLDTLAVHAGVESDPLTGAVMTPIYATSTYAQESPGTHKGFEYTRTSNPTRLALEKALAELEYGKRAFAFSSGCVAMDTLLHLCQVGDEVLCIDDVYGGSNRLLRKVWSRHGVKTNFVDMTQEGWEEHLSPQTKMVWIETPTNPLLKVVNIQKITEQVKKTQPQALVVVDNTFATPIIQNPLKLGADIVLHSMSKYLNGHSDVLAGAVVVKSEELAEEIHFYQNACGGVCSPFDSFLILRGLKTLAIRMDRHQETTMELAKRLSAHDKIEKVYYPGLESHSQHVVAKETMRGFGGMISAVIRGGQSQAFQFLEKVRLFTLAESLGGVESLIGHPATMTHAAVPEETRNELGITQSLVRFSVGLEHVDDLWEDINSALKQIS